jgi:hypothetical protein
MKFLGAKAAVLALILMLIAGKFLKERTESAYLVRGILAILAQQGQGSADTDGIGAAFEYGQEIIQCGADTDGLPHPVGALHGC